MDSILVTIFVGIIVAFVSQLIGHYLQLRRDRLDDDCAGEDTAPSP